MGHLVFIFVAGFCSVFLLGFQSRAVNHGNYGFASGNAFLIGITQTTLWGSLFSNLTWLSSIVYGLSGSLGIVASMYVHQRILDRKPRETDQ